MNSLFKKLLVFISYILTKSFFVLLQKGKCDCCEKEVLFYSFNPWLRDSLKCPVCNSIPRERALFHVLNKIRPKWKKLKIHESSPEFRGASLRLKEECSRYVASQFFENKELGKDFDGFVNQNLEEQTFEDESFDVVVTQDVFEHVFNPDLAFKEISRTLKKNGIHIFTTPLVNKSSKSLKWSEKDTNNKVKFLYEPEYHENPVNPEGSPVTMKWGFDIVDFIYEHTCSRTQIFTIDNLNLGIKAEFIEVLVTYK